MPQFVCQDPRIQGSGHDPASRVIVAAEDPGLGDLTEIDVVGFQLVQQPSHSRQLLGGKLRHPRRDSGRIDEEPGQESTAGGRSQVGCPDPRIPHGGLVCQAIRIQGPVTGRRLLGQRLCFFFICGHILLGHGQGRTFDPVLTRPSPAFGRGTHRHKLLLLLGNAGHGGLPEPAHLVDQVDQARCDHLLLGRIGLHEQLFQVIGITCLTGQVGQDVGNPMLPGARAEHVSIRLGQALAPAQGGGTFNGRQQLGMRHTHGLFTIG
jgi:hypothetical protein